MFLTFTQGFYCAATDRTLHSSCRISVEKIPQKGKIDRRLIKLISTIKLIWQNILDRHKGIKGWGNPMLELQSFLTFQMFTHHQIDGPITNVQNDYTLWNEGRVSPFGRHPNFESTGEALQIHAPNDSLLDRVSLQRAVSQFLNLFLDKQWTLSRWNAGLNKNLQTYIDTSLNGDKLDVNTLIQLQRRREMVKYAVNDCLAVSRISSEISKLSQQHKQQQHQSASSPHPQQIASSLPISSPPSSEQQPSSTPLPSTIEPTSTVLISPSSQPAILVTTTSSLANQRTSKYWRNRKTDIR
ncbi:unnamed protein product [Didymodactylos carnosus]|uniref:Uncharacterized protein n=1 Tax=Didymodactylos carnosus TaxID=1234261 RepID=A0A816BST4_9BILA|nr:unnamed protein product [Didymodactylos carnosus]CAF1611500.1 unnamed protein product [Didymodactylos carnosus]CAF4082573.1 unnamed protein product [Didymodactylos carnosus]CAF4494557.1 unnamed protein product [Didymodactylos carnosus]